MIIRLRPTATGHCVIDNNIIQFGGEIHLGCIGVWIGHSGDNQVTHNDIGGFYSLACPRGWRLGPMVPAQPSATTSITTTSITSKACSATWALSITLGPV